MTSAKYPVYGNIDGPIVMIGFGSIGRGTLPLIERHFTFDKKRMVVIDPRNDDEQLLKDKGIRYVQAALTGDNYKDVLGPLFSEAKVRGSV